MSNLSSEGRIDAAPERPESGGDKALESVDRISLLQSDYGKAGNSQTELASNNASEPDVLDFSVNDPLQGFAKTDSVNSAGSGPQGGSLDSRQESATSLGGTVNSDVNKDGVTDVRDMTRRIFLDAPQEANSDKQPEANEKTGEVKPKDADGDKSPETIEKSPEVAEQETKPPFEFVGERPNLDPNKPTVVFLDNFKSPHKPDLIKDKATNKLAILSKTEIPLNTVNGVSENGTMLQDEKGFTHGEFSSRMAEENGFNAVRLQQRYAEEDVPTNLGTSLNRIADLVDKGELKLGPGDVVNVSMGNADLTFDEVNDFLKSTDKNKITPENIDEPEVQKDILKRMAEVASDPNLPSYDAQWLRNAIDTNKAIERLQSMGIEVSHAAQNSGRGSVSLEFMKVDHELSSVNSKNGEPDKYTTDHDLIDEGNGVLPIRFKPGSESGPNKNGQYIIEGTGVKFDAKEFGGANKLEKINLGGKNHERSEEAVKKFFEQTVGRDAPPLENENGHLVAVATGNSFVNIQFLASQRERLARTKAEARNK